MSALSLAIYGMFVAIVVPEMKKSRAVVFVVLLALVLSCMFYYVPFLSRISSGITITVGSHCGCSYRFAAVSGCR